ncbi:MAG: Gfo/Idh/MocA family oxidoreductase [Firmicutes bacterium]|nr:Gfo/Idh/MocA family oxidoreductase [Bacillota bacterium]
MKKVRWGILGSGWIVGASFVPALHRLGREAADAVIASRTPERAAQKAAEWELAGWAAPYDALIARDDIDVVYIALPNHLHEEWAVRALEAGKHVLVEKPLGLTVASEERMMAAADRSHRYLWEAYAFLFREQTRELVRRIQAGDIGAVTSIQSRFYADIGEDNIRWQPALGGGALYDLGVYPLRLAALWFSDPVRVSGTFRPHRGVDAETMADVWHPGAHRLQFAVGFTLPFQTGAVLYGTEGRFVVTNPYHPAPHDRVFVERRGEWEPVAVGDDGPTFFPMLSHITRAVAGEIPAGHRAGPGSLAVIRTVEQLRAAMTPI